MYDHSYGLQKKRPKKAKKNGFRKNETKETIKGFHYFSITYTLTVFINNYYTNFTSAIEQEHSLSKRPPYVDIILNEDKFWATFLPQKQGVNSSNS